MGSMEKGTGPSGLGRHTPLGPMRLGLGGNPKGGAPLAWGASLPPWPPPPSRSIWRGPAPLSLAPINRGGGVGGQPHPWQGAALSSSNSSSSSSVVLSEALPENHELHCHHAVVLLELSLNFSSPLAGSTWRRRPWAVHVLNMEAPFVRRQIGSSAI